MSNISPGEYYRVQYSYLHNEEIIYGGQNFKITADKETLLRAIQWYYDQYKKFDVRVGVLKCKVEKLALEIKPVAWQFDLETRNNI